MIFNCLKIFLVAVVLEALFWGTTYLAQEYSEELTWMALLEIPIIIGFTYYYLRYVIQARLVIVTLLLSYIIFIPLTVVVIIWYIGVSKGATLGIEPDSLTSFLTVAGFIGIIATYPASLAFLYMLFNPLPKYPHEVRLL